MLGFVDLLRLELRTLLADRAIMLTLFGGVIFYSFLYPQPYLHQLPREEAVVVVNDDGSQLSRQLEFMADATPQVKLVARANSLAEARQLMMAGEASGILHIPNHFYRDLMLGKSVTLSYAGDASYFLVYGTIAEGLAQAGGTLAAQVKVARLLSHGEALPQAAMGWNAVALNVVPVFNPTMGYVNYVVPAVFVLILHQVLLMGAGILGGDPESAQLPRRAWLLAKRACIAAAAGQNPGADGVVPAAGELLPRLLLRSLQYRSSCRSAGAVAVCPAVPAGDLLVRDCAGGHLYPARSAHSGGAHLLSAAGLSGGLYLAAGADPGAPQLAGSVGAHYPRHRGFSAPQPDGGRLCAGFPLLVAAVGTGAALRRTGLPAAALAAAVAAGCSPVSRAE